MSFSWRSWSWIFSKAFCVRSRRSVQRCSFSSFAASLAERSLIRCQGCCAACLLSHSRCAICLSRASSFCLSACLSCSSDGAVSSAIASSSLGGENGRTTNLPEAFFATTIQSPSFVRSGACSSSCAFCASHFWQERVESHHHELQVGQTQYLEEDAVPELWCEATLLAAFATRTKVRSAVR